MVDELVVLAAVAWTLPLGSLPALIAAMLLGSWFVYAVLIEALWGRTLGKRLVGMEVVTVTGAPAGIAASLVRNLFKLAVLAFSACSWFFCCGFGRHPGQ